MFTVRICAAALLLANVACTHAASPSAGSQTAAPASHNPDVITAAELADPSVRSGDALEAVRRLRPRFLQKRGTGSIKDSTAGTVHVSIDGGPLQPAGALSHIRANEVGEIRYLSASEAAQRFGMLAATGSVILVKTK